MSQDIRDFVTPSCRLFAFGEPTHREPAFAEIRNELFAQLAGLGFRSIALETDRVAALAVNDFVQEGKGTLDAAMRDGFSHNFGHIEGNKRLVAWMRDYNESRPSEERLAFHGFDTSTEMMNAPSPRRYLEHARDYLKLDLDIAGLAGDDERWSRTEAIMDPAMSPGATAEAESLRAIADDMLTMLYGRAPELIAATGRAEWVRARTHLTAGLGLSRYHKVSAQPGEQNARWSTMSGTRDALMAQNLLDIREVEAGRGGTMVFAHNLHLQRGSSFMEMGPMDVRWSSAGAIVGSLVGEQYTFVAGSIGRSAGIDLPEPPSHTYEGGLQSRVSSWGLVAGASIATARTRTGITPIQGYFPLDQANLDGAAAVMHINAGTDLMPVESGLRLPEHV
jgi:erythromycin esterase-like protein